MKRIPLILVSVPAGWLVFIIFFAFEYIEKDSNSLPAIPAMNQMIVVYLDFNTSNNMDQCFNNITSGICL